MREQYFVVRGTTNGDVVVEEAVNMNAVSEILAYHCQEMDQINPKYGRFFEKDEIMVIKGNIIEPKPVEKITRWVE